MRQDKLSQRLKLRRDSFDFNALIEGVSTLIEDDKHEAAEQPLAPAPKTAPERPALIEDRAGRIEPPTPAPPAEGPASVVPAVGAALAAEHLFVEYQVVEAVRPVPAPPAPAVAPIEAPAPPAAEEPAAAPIAAKAEPAHVASVPSVQAVQDVQPAQHAPAKPASPAAPAAPAAPRAAEPVSVYSVEVTEQEAALLTPRPEAPPANMPAAVALSPAPAEPARISLSAAAERPASLTAALESLAARLVQTVSRLRAALYADDPDEAGFYLAHTNQVLELLSAIDPSGDAARDLRIRQAPPAGRPWPGSAWSIAEFAESPLSGLLPASADARFVQRLLYSAWGVSVETIQDRDEPALAGAH